MFSPLKINWPVSEMNGSEDSSPALISLKDFEGPHINIISMTEGPHIIIISMKEVPHSNLISTMCLCTFNSKWMCVLVLVLVVV